MTEKLKDQVSALLDDELDARECKLLLARLAGDRELVATWERYSLIGDCIRNNLPAQASLGIAERVARAVQSDQNAAAVLPAKRARLGRGIAGMAVAASVALIAIVSLQNLDKGAPDLATPAAFSATDDSYTVPVINMREQASASLRERLNFYQVSHSEFAGPMQRRALISQMASDQSLDEEPETATEPGTR